MNTPRVLGVIPDSPASRRFLEREIGSRPTPMGLGSAYRACPSCGERAAAWVSGQCVRCHDRQRSLAATWRDLATKAPPARQTPAPPPAATARAADSAELRAYQLGVNLRAQFPNDPVGTIAAALNYTVEYVAGNELQGSTDTWTVTGRCLPDHGRIWVLNGLPFAERERVLAHEIAHCLLKPEIDPALSTWEAERTCDSFAFGLTGNRKPQ